MFRRLETEGPVMVAASCANGRMYRQVVYDPNTGPSQVDIRKALQIHDECTGIKRRPDGTPDPKLPACPDHCAIRMLVEGRY